MGRPMKKKLFFKKATLLLLIILINVQVVFSVPEQDIINNNAESLVKLGILNGYEDGTLKLDNKIKRSEFITLIVNLMGYDKDTLLDEVKIGFKDINPKHWAYNNIKLSIKYSLVSGYPDNTIAPDKNVTFAEALTVVTRALGYENTLEGKWPDNVLIKANELNLNANIDLTSNHQLTRGEMSMIVYNALTVKFNEE